MTIAVIPARYGSTRLKGKPLALISGKPMIQRVFEQASGSPSISKTIVATDDERIVDAVKAFGGQALMTSDSCRTGTDRVAETAQMLDIEPDEVVVNIQGDQPVFHPDSIEDLIHPFSEDPNLLMSTLAYKIIDKREIMDPSDVKVTFDNNGFALYFSRAQIPYPRDGQKDIDYFKHLGFYAYKKSFLDTLVALPTGRWEAIEKLEQLRVLEHGYKIKVIVTANDSPSIDMPQDIERIEKKIFNK